MGALDTAKFMGVGFAWATSVQTAPAGATDAPLDIISNHFYQTPWQGAEEGGEDLGRPLRRVENSK